MKRITNYLAIALLCLGTIACRKDAVGTVDNTSSSGSSSSGETTVVDKTLSATDAITVTFNGTSDATVTGADDIGWTYSVDGGYVVLGESSTTVSNLTVNVKGSTTAGSLKIYNASAFNLVLNSVSITSKSGYAINIRCDAACNISLTGSSTLTDSSSYSDDSAKGALHSEGSLNFSGSGSLAVTASYKHGIISEGSITISGGTITVSDSASGGKGIKADEDITFKGGTTSVTCTGSAVYEDSDVTGVACIKADGTIDVEDGTITCKASGSGGKGIRCEDYLQNGGDVSITTTGGYFSTGDGSSPKGLKAGTKVSSSSGTGSIIINDGELYIYTTGGNSSTNTIATRADLETKGGPGGGGNGPGGGNDPGHGGNQPGGSSESGAEGMESKNTITINGGYVAIQADDDAINATTKITINGGYVYAYGVNNDGIDSNGTSSGAITITGGVVMAHSTSSPEEGIDCDNMQLVLFQGGTIFSSGGAMGGSSGGSPKLSNVAGTYLSNTSVSQGYFAVTDASGNVIMECYVPRAMSQNYSYIISDKMSSGSTYYYGATSSVPSSPSDSWTTDYSYGYYYYGGSISKPSSSFSAKSSL